MAIDTWAALMTAVRQRDIVNAAGDEGGVTPRMAHDWARNGLPHFEHYGYQSRCGFKVTYKKRWKAIQRAALAHGITITGDEILRLSLEHKQKLAEGKL